MVVPNHYGDEEYHGNELQVYKYGTFDSRSFQWDVVNRSRPLWSFPTTLECSNQGPFNEMWSIGPGLYGRSQPLQ